MNKSFESIGDLFPIDLEIIKNLEEILGYQFQQPKFALDALTHPSHSLKLELQISSAFQNYERLEFLGDSLLGLIITECLFDWSPELTPAEITDWRSCIISNEYLGVICIQTGLYQYIRHSSPPLKYDISLYKERLEQTINFNDICTVPPQPQNSSSPSSSPPSSTSPLSLSVSNNFFHSKINPPKVLADIIESLIAAIFVDSNGRIEDCYQVVSSLIFEPYIIPLLADGTNSIWGCQRHPISIVHEIISSFNCHQVQFIYTTNNNRINNNTNNNNHNNNNDDDETQCSIVCHNEIISIGYGKNKKRARLAASIQLASEKLIHSLQTNCTCNS